MPTAPSTFSWLGVPQAPGDEPSPPEGGKNLGGRPLKPKEISGYRDTLGQIRAADNTAGRSATRHLERFRSRLICGIWCTPHLTGMYGTRPFFGWDRRRSVAHTRPEFAKNALGPVGIPGQIRAADNTAGRSATRQLERFRSRLICHSGSKVS